MRTLKHLALLLLVCLGITPVASAQTLNSLRTTDGVTTVYPTYKLTFLTGCTIVGVGTEARITCTGSGISSIVSDPPLSGAGTSASHLTLNYGTGLTLSTGSLVINQAFSPTWTGAHTFNQTVTLTNATSLYGPNGLVYSSGIADSGSTTAHIMNTTNALTGARNLLAVRNSGVSKFVINWDGDITLGRSATPGDSGTRRFIKTEASTGVDQQGTTLVLAGGDGGPGNGPGGTVVLQGGTPNGTGIYGGVDACFNNCGRLYLGGSLTNPTTGGVIWPFGAWALPVVFQKSLATGQAAITAQTGNPGTTGDAVETRGGNGGVADSSNNGGDGGYGVVKGGVGGASTVSRPGGNGGNARVVGGVPGANNGGGTGNYGAVVLEGSQILAGTGTNGEPAATSITIGSTSAVTTVVGQLIAPLFGQKWSRVDVSGTTTNVTPTDTFIYLKSLGGVARAIILPDPAVLSLSTNKTQCFVLKCDASCSGTTVFIYAPPSNVTLIDGTATNISTGSGARLLTEAWASATLCTEGTNYYVQTTYSTAFAINP